MVVKKEQKGDGVEGVKGRKVGRGSVKGRHTL